MNVFDFEKSGIPVNTPGFYNHPKFLEIEGRNPAFLNEYNGFVVRRRYEQSYLVDAAKRIRIVAQVLFEELKRDGRKGACIDICQAFSKVLEREGVWCCTFSGSMTIVFNKETGITNRYFWAVDEGNFHAPHTWIFAPPYKVIDLSISLQHYEGNEREYLPDYLMEEKTILARMCPIDFINPAVVPRGMTMEAAMSQEMNNAPDVRKFVNDFPPLQVLRDKCSITYFPIRANASDGELEQLRAISFSGKYAIDIYEGKIKPKIRET